MTNIEILESLNIKHKQLKEDKPLLLLKILQAMDLARTEAINFTDSSIQLNDKNIDTFEEWKEYNCFKKMFGIYEYKGEHYELSDLKSIYEKELKDNL